LLSYMVSGPAERHLRALTSNRRQKKGRRKIDALAKNHLGELVTQE